MPQHGDTDSRSAVDILIASDRVPANARPDLLTEDDIWALLEEVKDPDGGLLEFQGRGRLHWKLDRGVAQVEGQHLGRSRARDRPCRAEFRAIPIETTTRTGKEG